MFQKRGSSFPKNIKTVINGLVFLDFDARGRIAAGFDRVFADPGVADRIAGVACFPLFSPLNFTALNCRVPYEPELSAWSSHKFFELFYAFDAFVFF